MAALRSVMVLCLLSAGGLAGCGGDLANLTVRIESLSGEDPFDGVGYLRLTVELDRAGQVEYSGALPIGQDSLELPELALHGSVRVILDGFRDDSLTLLLAAGSTPWISPEAGRPNEAVICFCKVATIKAGGCACP